MSSRLHLLTKLFLWNLFLLILSNLYVCFLVTNIAPLFYFVSPFCGKPYKMKFPILALCLCTVQQCSVCSRYYEADLQDFHPARLELCVYWVSLPLSPPFPVIAFLSKCLVCVLGVLASVPSIPCHCFPFQVSHVSFSNSGFSHLPFLSLM